MALIISFGGKTPTIHPTAFVAPNATLIGDVHVGPRASIWFGAVLRGDMDRIEVGEGSNLQDGVVAHTDTGVPTRLGKNVGVGHLVLVHGTTVEDGCLIGMGAKLLNNSLVETGAFVAASALVLEGQIVPAGHLVAGVPARVRGLMDSELQERVRINAFRYQELSWAYLSQGIGAQN